ncbi:MULTISPECIES: amidase [Streptomyces]|uniref:amidase n=1 Tax=Streptomyces TaxID=1883 RepID=UPI0007675B08|nr:MULTISPECIES: amidase [Streptomyces]MBW8086634.1 amidase [Streptomyces hygroscopicus subsp. hygroscopicus]MCO8307823.1 amidase [Streptomyces sp. RKCA744]MDN3056074.1 amidase [Streptomyces sp. SRF1]
MTGSSIPEEELAWLDATAQADLVRRKVLSPTELVEAAIGRIERLDRRLNAVVTPLFEKALAAAGAAGLPDGPFRGVPMLLKDFLCHTAGDPAYGGMRALRDRDWRAPEDSALAARFRSAGFVFCGKTNLPELATSITTEPLAHGATRNPWDLTRSPGGSSGGSAAAVAAGMVPVAHGNDMAGSIRMPASACGVVGLKPSRARTTLGPAYGEYWGPVTHEHVLTRSVRDTAAVLDATAGPASGDPYTAPPALRPYREEVGADPGVLRIGFRTTPPGATNPAHKDCVAAVEHAARLLDSLGHRVEPTSAPCLDDPALFEALVPLFAAVLAWELDQWSERVGERLEPADLEPMNEMLARVGRSVTAAQWLSGTQAWQRWARGVAGLWDEEVDVLLTPTLPAPPAVLGALAPTAQSPEELVAAVSGGIAFTVPFNVTGQPAISLPLYRSDDGLPIGVQLVAAYGREDVLIRLASQLEQAAPWSGERPPSFD